MNCDRCDREPVYKSYFGYCIVCHDYLKEQEELRQLQTRNTDTEQTTL